MADLKQMTRTRFLTYLDENKIAHNMLDLADSSSPLIQRLFAFRKEHMGNTQFFEGNRAKFDSGKFFNNMQLIDFYPGQHLSLHPRDMNFGVRWFENKEIILFLNHHWDWTFIKLGSVAVVLDFFSNCTDQSYAIFDTDFKSCMVSVGEAVSHFPSRMIYMVGAMVKQIMRDEKYQKKHPSIESSAKKLGILPERLDRVSMHEYQNILQRLESSFVRDSGDLHWSNLGRIRQPHTYYNLMCNARVGFWMPQLHQILTTPQEPMYLLFEDAAQKYWVYEGYLDAIIPFCYHLVFGDVYIVSKKMEWLATENHHGGLTLAGNLHAERFDYDLLYKDTFGEYSVEYEQYKRSTMRKK